MQQILKQQPNKKELEQKMLPLPFTEYHLAKYVRK